jgi:transposase
MDYYFVVVRMSRGKRFELRLRMVNCARREGIRQTARLFKASRNTVRKWLRRYEAGGVRTLEGLSRAPKHIPHKTPEKVAKRVRSLRRQFKGWGVHRLAMHFELGCSPTAAHRIMKEAGLTRRGPKKKRSRNDLRAEKARLRPFEKIQVDTKELRDIPRYAKWMRVGQLPRYQYSARDVRTGAAYLAYSQTNDSLKAAGFAGYVLHHLSESGVDLSSTTVQTDNGTEYVGGGRKKSAQSSLFESIVEHFTGKEVVRIFPGACRSQSDVESFHRLVEEELYEVEDLRTETELLGKAHTYQLYFNHLRKNLYKGGSTPRDILLEADKHANSSCLTLPPIRLESLPLHLLPHVGHHVPGLVIHLDPQH